MGRKRQPHYRVVVSDSHAPRDGRIVENLGYYRPKATPARLVLDLERVEYWIGHGAKPSDTVSSLVRRARQGGGPDLALGEPDGEAQRKHQSEALAARRVAERKEREMSEADEPGEPARGEEEAASATGGSAVEATAEVEDAQADAAEAEVPAEEPASQQRRGGRKKGARAEGAGGS